MGKNVAKFSTASSVLNLSIQTAYLGCIDNRGDVRLGSLPCHTSHRLIAGSELKQEQTKQVGAYTVHGYDQTGQKF